MSPRRGFVWAVEAHLYFEGPREYLLESAGQRPSVITKVLWPTGCGPSYGCVPGHAA